MKQKSLSLLTAALAMSSLLVSSVAVAQPSPGEPHPLHVVAMALTLSEDQIQNFADVLQDRIRAIQPLAEKAHARHEEIAKALDTPDADPAAVGKLLIEIRQLQQQIAVVNAEAAARFEEVLTTEQRERLGHLREAARVCPILPAFQAVGLL